VIIAYIGLGSNLNNPAEQLRKAGTHVAALAGIQQFLMSSLYKSAPMGPQNQPYYINAVAQIMTSLTPVDLLSELMRIEALLGRRRSGERWSARVIDLDILLYGDEIINSTELVIPHPGLYERAFVLYPLQEIAPGIEVPGYGPLAQLLAVCDKGDLALLADVNRTTMG